MFAAVALRIYEGVLQAWRERNRVACRGSIGHCRTLGHDGCTERDLCCMLYEGGVG